MDVAIHSSRSPPFQLTPRKRHLTRNPQFSQLVPSDILPDELWLYIAYELSIADRLRFRAVCKSWTSLVPSRMPPWLMLAEPDEQEDPGRTQPAPRGFVSLGEQWIYTCDVSELQDSRCVGSSGNWVITAHKDKSLRLLNPFDKRPIYLPSVALFDNAVFNANPEVVYDEDLGQILIIEEEFELTKIELWKVILNSSPSKWRDCVAMAIHHSQKILAFARLGDHKWKTVEIKNPRGPSKVEMEIGGKAITFEPCIEVNDVIFYYDQFYAITNYGELLVCDLGDGEDPPKATYLCGPMDEFSLLRVNYLVEWLGELLMVRKSVDVINNGLSYKTTKFDIYRFDFVHGEWTELKSLGEHSLFLGLNTSVSFCASDYFGLVKKNCVYFTDDFVSGSMILSRSLGRSIPFGHDMGVFDLEDKCITPHFKYAALSVSLFSPPVWVVPPEKDSVMQDKYPRWSDW